MELALESQGPVADAVSAPSAIAAEPQSTRDASPEHDKPRHSFRRKGLNFTLTTTGYPDLLQLLGEDRIQWTRRYENGRDDNTTTFTALSSMKADKVVKALKKLGFSQLAWKKPAK